MRATQVRPWRGRRAALACAVALAAAALAGGAGATPPPAIESLRGAVEVGAGEPERWRPASAGEALAAGDAVRTGDDGRAEIRLQSGVVRLYENSLLRLPADSPRPDRERVRMERGSSLFDVLRRSESDRFEVETPEVAVMVKGTRFSVALHSRGTSVAVWRGSVGVRALAAALDREMLVRPGFAAVGGAGSPFELVLNPGGDPWDGWQQDAPLPPLPTASLPQGAELSSAREAALAALKAALNGRPGLARELFGGGGEPGATERRGEAKLPAALDLGAPEANAPPTVDPASDERNRLLGGALQEKFAESVLAGTSGSSSFDVQVVTSGGPNYAVITGPSVSTTVTKNDVDTILQTGDPSLLDPALLNQLNQNGVDPIRFVEQLDDLL
jgi:hypothetical protein